MFWFVRKIIEKDPRSTFTETPPSVPVPGVSKECPLDVVVAVFSDLCLRL